MRRFLMLSIALLLVLAVSGFAQDHSYIGTKRCMMCHRGERNGMIAEKWQEGPHAKAYEVLASDKALKVYADMGKTGNPQEDAECLKCHVTGYTVDGGTPEGVDMTNGVTCEGCHGAGSDYWKKSIMEDRELSIQNGMVANPKEDCVDCHNENSPTYKPFNLEEFYGKIKHELSE